MHADAVVVGGGAVGSAAARRLAERGLAVVLLEQFEVGHRRGSSTGPTRIFRFAYPEPDYVELAVRALDAWRRLEAAAGEQLLVTTGGLDAGPEAELCADALAACGARHEWLPAERFPWLSEPPGGRVLYHPDAGVCLAERTIAAQVRLARAAGATVLERTAARGLSVDSDAVRVELADGEIEAPVAVVTAGAWASRLLAAAGRPLAIETTLTHVAYFRPRTSDRLTTFVETDAARPDWYAYVVPDGGTGAGVKVGQALGALPVDADRGPFDVDGEWIDRHADYVRRRLPGLDPTPLSPETCLYAGTPDDDFVVDRQGPLVLGVGLGGHGFKFVPLLGELLAALAAGDEPTLPARFSASRPALRATLGVR